MGEGGEGVCVCVYVCVCVHLLMFVLLHNVYNACLCVYVSCQQVVLGGGQEAREVTTTTTKAGKFDARFYHLVFEEKIGRVKGHFGPIIHLHFIQMKKRWALIRV